MLSKLLIWLLLNRSRCCYRNRNRSKLLRRCNFRSRRSFLFCSFFLLFWCFFGNHFFCRFLFRLLFLFRLRYWLFFILSRDSSWFWFRCNLSLSLSCCRPGLWDSSWLHLSCFGWSGSYFLGLRFQFLFNRRSFLSWFPSFLWFNFFFILLLLFNWGPSTFFFLFALFFFRRFVFRIFFIWLFRFHFFIFFRFRFFISSFWLASLALRRRSFSWKRRRWFLFRSGLSFSFLFTESFFIFTLGSLENYSRLKVSKFSWQPTEACILRPCFMTCIFFLCYFFMLFNSKPFKFFIFFWRYFSFCFLLLFNSKHFKISIYKSCRFLGRRSFLNRWRCRFLNFMLKRSLFLFRIRFSIYSKQSHFSLFFCLSFNLFFGLLSGFLEAFMCFWDNLMLFSFISLFNLFLSIR